MHLNDDIILGVYGEVVGILFDSPTEESNVGIVPGHRAPQLHQQKLAVDAGVGPVDDALRKIDARIAGFAAIENDYGDLAKQLAETPASAEQIGGFAIGHIHSEHLRLAARNYRGVTLWVRTAW